MRRITSFAVLSAAAGTMLYACDSDPTGPDLTDIGIELVAEGLTAPVTLTEAPDGTGRLFVVDQAGMIRVVSAAGDLLTTPFLDLRGRMVTLRATFDERGLLGLAFHPQYATNGRFYVYYSAPRRAGAPLNFDHTSHIAEFRVSAGNANVADAGSERIVLQVDEPQFNHDGGTLAFGPDGFLYISLGDGGGGNDTGIGHVEDWHDANGGGNGQDITQNLLGSILRIDVNSGNPYAIPSDNPFVSGPGLDEIWAYGFRNPYRFSFDMGGERSLIVGDAGQELYEEISVVVRGGNYGWNVKEGAHCFDAEAATTPPASCPTVDPEGDPLIDPVIELLNSKNSADGIGVVVVGGHVYRGDAIRGLDGRYVFGVWSTSFTTGEGAVLIAEPTSGGGTWDYEEIALAGRAGGALGHFLLGFGQDADGEVYLLTSDSAAPVGGTGRVYRLISGAG